MTKSSDASTTLRALLPGVRLTSINVVELEARRRAPGPIDPSGKDVALHTAYQVGEDTIAYRFSAEIDCPEFRLAATAVIRFEVDDLDKLRDDQALLDAFGERIALPAIYPYVRQRLHDLSVSIDLPGVLLPLWRNGDTLVTEAATSDAVD